MHGSCRLFMNHRPVALLILVLCPIMTAMAELALNYPSTRREDVVETYHGMQVTDPYRWLEDDHAEETKAWVRAQNEVTFGFLKRIPSRDPIKERLTSLWNYERIGQPLKRGGRYFFMRNTGLQNQAVLLVTDALDAEPRVLLDPNAMWPDGTVSLSDHEPSEDGRLLAYGISKGGSDWNEVFVRDIGSGVDREDHLCWVKFSGLSWLKDGSGFFYSRYDAPKEGEALTKKNEFHKLYFHKLGTPQSADRLVYERRDHAGWGFSGAVTDDGDYLVIHVWEGTEPNNRLFYLPLGQAAAPVVELLSEADARYDFIDNDGPVFFFQTDLDAPRHRVIAIDTRQPERKNWREIIPQSEDMLDDVSAVGGQLICEYLRDAKSAVRCFDLTGRLIRDLELPGIGSTGGFDGRREDSETFYSFTSFTEPGAIYRLDLTSGQSRIWKKPQVDFDGGSYETKQVFYTSKDGTQVPMFIVHRRGLKLDGHIPTLLYGYGGFNVSLTPGFSVARAVWLEMGGVFAMPNLRGGEYGREWHEAGIKLKKQNTFDDFIAAAEWLIAHGYTLPRKLAIQGGSNGGLLVGVCMTQRPDLFAATLPSVGVMDMLRYEQFTIGWGWKSDYGSAVNVDEFKALLGYSPYHNLKPGIRYPASLITTADHDDRVVPAHSFKFAARLQECQAKDGPPVLIRIETSAGHGAGTALAKMIEETADEWAFLSRILGMDAFVAELDSK